MRCVELIGLDMLCYHARVLEHMTKASIATTQTVYLTYVRPS
jgi:hypothetical protein